MSFSNGTQRSQSFTIHYFFSGHQQCAKKMVLRQLLLSIGGGKRSDPTMDLVLLDEWSENWSPCYLISRRIS
jgi:hypothetical protein